MRITIGPKKPNQRRQTVDPTLRLEKMGTDFDDVEEV